MGIAERITAAFDHKGSSAKTCVTSMSARIGFIKTLSAASHMTSTHSQSVCDRQMKDVWQTAPPMGMSATGQKRTSLWQQLVRKTLHAAGHRYLDSGDKAPGRAWLGRDHLDPKNEDGSDHDGDNG